MRQVIAALFCVLAIGGSEAAGDPARCDATLKLPEPQKGVLTVSVAEDGAPVDREFDNFLLKVLRHFDRNQDETWDAAEAERVFSWPTAAGKMVALQFADADADKDGQIKFVELYRWCCNRQIGLLCSPPEQQGANDARLSKLFAVACDADRNGRVDVAELRAAPRKLQRYDLNDDEILDWKELQAAAELPDRQRKGPGNEATQETSSKRLSPWLVLYLGKQPSAALSEIDRVSKLSVSDTRFALRPDGGACVIGGKLHRALPDLDTVAEFLVAQLEEASAGKGSLLKSAAAKEESLRGVLDLFSFADRNGDDQLTAAELREYLALLATGLRAQYALGLHDRDQNWFSYLDVDGDLRLTPLELTRLRDLPLQSDGQIGRFLELEVGTVPVTVWGGVRIPAPAKTKVKAVFTPNAPAWFSAQDRNGDGVVSRREFLGPITRFRELDKNSDELIELAEAAP